jgi:hypothetical protein
LDKGILRLSIKIFFLSPFVGMLRRKSLLLSYGTLQYGKEGSLDNMLSKAV